MSTCRINWRQSEFRTVEHKKSGTKSESASIWADLERGVATLHVLSVEVLLLIVGLSGRSFRRSLALENLQSRREGRLVDEGQALGPGQARQDGQGHLGGRDSNPRSRNRDWLERRRPKSKCCNQGKLLMKSIKEPWSASIQSNSEPIKNSQKKLHLHGSSLETYSST